MATRKTPPSLSTPADHSDDDELPISQGIAASLGRIPAFVSELPALLAAHGRPDTALLHIAQGVMASEGRIPLYMSDQSSLYAPSVGSDLADYAPGSTAILTASGFPVGSLLQFEVDHAIDPGADGLWGTPDDVLDSGSGAGHEPWLVTDGGAGDLDGLVNGSVTTSWYVNPDDSLGATFLLSATAAGADGVFGSADDLLATASFTDSEAGVVATGVTVSLDESDGLQNVNVTPGAPEDANDNDILLASLPADFTSRLTALSAGPAMEAALSGYNGAPGNTGSEAFTITPAPGGSITDVSFVDGDGAPLEDTDSGLLTLDGRKIFLYTDSANNNILLGRLGAEGPTDAPGDDVADPSGAIVFAAYIEETGTPVSGGKIWTVLYQPLKHADASNHDDALNLLNKVFIGTSQDLQFSLANAPSGQNLFLMFTTATPEVVEVAGVLRITDPTIIATGKNPANQSTGVNINTGDTINTSQAGGPTTFGTNNQMIVEQEGIRFTFVTGARQDVTIPNLDQNEADLEANIDFTAMFNARSAEFDVVQLQSGKTAQVKISAFTTAAEPGVDFIDGYGNDTPVTIESVRVINLSTGQVIENSDGSVNDPGIVISLVGGVASITGVKAGYQIEYSTSSDHNRVLIENGAAVDAKGNNHADFDIGGFRLLQVTTATAEIGSKMIFEDDGPSIAANLLAVPTLTTDDTDIPDSTDPTSFAGLFNSAFGEDGFKDADNNDVEDADAIAYALGVSADNGVDSGLRDTLSGDKIFLFLEGGAVVGRVGTAGDLADAGGTEAFRISVVANTGNVTLTQSRAVVHDDPLDPDEPGASAAGLLAASLVTLTATATDGDGDTATATRDIGDAFKFKDDGPSITANLVAVPTLTTDDTDIPDSDGPVSFAGLFNSDFGEDGFKDSDDDDVEDADAITYALGVSADNGADSGLRDTLSGDKIFLFLEGGAVVGRVGTAGGLADAAGAEALRISVLANTGEVSLTQSRAVVHDDPLDPDEPGTSAAGLMAASLVTLTATATDGDGDTATATRDIGDAFKFKDDGPSIATNLVAVPTLTTDDTNIPDSDGPVSFAGLFGVADFGEDGFKDSDDDDVEDADAITYALGVSADNGADSGLRDTLSGDKIFLFLEGGAVVGRVGTADNLANPAGAVAFTISVVTNTGAVTLTQSRSIVHDDPLDPDEPGTSAAGLMAASLVTLTATATDGDGDTATATRDIGDAFKFKDDGPSITANLVAVPTLTTDDTNIPDSDGPVSFAGLFGVADFGADGFKDVDDDDVADADAITYALGVSADNGADSGLLDTLTGRKIYLFLEGGAVVGRVGTAGGLADAAGAEALRISVLANTGEVSLTQSRAVVHDDPLDPDEPGASAAGLLAASLVTLTATATDGDGDTATATRDIGDAFKFKDDGPSLAFGNLIGTGTTLAQYGFWSMAAGADGLGAAGLDITLESVTLVRPDGTTTTGSGTLTEQSPSPDGAYQFAGTLSGDFNNNGVADDPSIDYTLTAFADGTYALDLVQGFSSTVVRSSADGALGAGGPDPVRTLLIPEQDPPTIPSPSEEIVFFGVNATTSAADILTAIGPGAPDLSEAQVEAGGFAFLGTANMNVSTSGIGIGNNNLDGNGTAGINAGDESFVINPETLLTGLKVFIDNSVQGYNPATEELYYRIFYADESSSAQIKVEAADLTAEAGGQTSFLIEREGSKLIDAVQLTMGLGVIKIPVIEFIQESENLASDIQLAFSATLTDGDGDTATSSFDAKLFANEPASAAFNFLLAGTDGERDAFNIDLSGLENLYQVTGFDANASPGLRDSLVLIGDPSVPPGNISINNAGDDSIVTVLETGGQTTIITVVGVAGVGVDLVPSDIVIA